MLGSPPAVGGPRPCPPRVALSGMVISRPALAVGRYRMIKHGHDKGNEQNPKRCWGEWVGLGKGGRVGPRGGGVGVWE